MGDFRGYESGSEKWMDDVMDAFYRLSEECDWWQLTSAENGERWQLVIRLWGEGPGAYGKVNWRRRDESLCSMVDRALEDATIKRAGAKRAALEARPTS